MNARTAARVKLFTESVIREMTRLNNLHGGINLAQGFPDFAPPADLVAAAVQALQDGHHQYAITCRDLRALLRELRAGHAALRRGAAVRPAAPGGPGADVRPGRIARRVLAAHPSDHPEHTGFRSFPPRGAYSIMADFRDLSREDDVAFARRLVADVGVATVPGSSFYHDPALGRSYVRFAFPKMPQTLAAAAERLQRVREAVGR